MNQYVCAITGETHCKCLEPKGYGLLSQIDVKASFRKLFTDHAVYTAFVLKSLVDGVPASAFVDRLILNQHDIGNQLSLMLGNEIGNRATILLVEHINLAAEVITSKVHGDSNLDLNIQRLFANSDLVADFLSSLNPEKLPQEVVRSMFHTHNQYVINMTVQRFYKEYKNEQVLYDSYYNQILDMSDAIVNAL